MGKMNSFSIIAGITNNNINKTTCRALQVARLGVTAVSILIFSSATAMAGSPYNLTIPAPGAQFRPHVAQPALHTRPTVKHNIGHTKAKKKTTHKKATRTQSSVRRVILKPAAQRSLRGGVQVHRRAPAISTDQHGSVGIKRLQNRFGTGNHVLAPVRKGRLGKTGNGGFAPVRSTKNNRGATSDGTLQRSLNRSHPSSRRTQFIPQMPPAQRNRSKDDRRSGEYANTLINQWAEDDMAIGGGKVPDPDNAPIETFPSRGKNTASGVEYNNGDLTRIESDGSKTIRHRDGTTDRVDAHGNIVHVGEGVKAIPGQNGGTDFEDTTSGTRGHFGVSHVRNDPGGIKETSPGHGQLPDGSRITDETNGSITVNNTDGSIDTWQRDGSHLHTGPDTKTMPSADGGTDVMDIDGKFSAHFGGGETTTEEGSPKYIGGGTVQNPDGSKEQGKKPSYYSSNSDNSTDSSSSSDDSSSSSGDDSGSSSASSDDSSDDSASSSDDSSDDSADSSDDSSDDSADSSDDSGNDDSSDESSIGFGGGRGGGGGPEPAAKTTVDDRVARMKGEKRDPESPDDPEPGNGGSAPDSVSQPGPGGSGGSGSSAEVRGHIQAGGTSPVNVRPGDMHDSKGPLDMRDPDRFGRDQAPPSTGASDQLRYHGDSVNPGER